MILVRWKKERERKKTSPHIIQENNWNIILSVLYEKNNNKPTNFPLVSSPFTICTINIMSNGIKYRTNIPNNANTSPPPPPPKILCKTLQRDHTSIKVVLVEDGKISSQTAIKTFSSASNKPRDSVNDTNGSQLQQKKSNTDSTFKKWSLRE